jgi:hypothetical protein
MSRMAHYTLFGKLKYKYRSKRGLEAFGLLDNFILGLSNVGENNSKMMGGEVLSRFWTLPSDHPCLSSCVFARTCVAVHAVHAVEAAVASQKQEGNLIFLSRRVGTQTDIEIQGMGGAGRQQRQRRQRQRQRQRQRRKKIELFGRGGGIRKHFTLCQTVKL